MSENGSESSGKSPDWGSAAGNAWVQVQDLTDSVYEPVAHLLTEEVARVGGRRVLDVGCGTGATTVAVARGLGPDAECTGLDVSEPMVAASRRRAQRAGLDIEFELANAETHEFPEGDFDLVISRWGVMFFSNPVAAFSNLRRATQGGKLRAIVWRSHTENPFLTVAERAAAPMLPDFEARSSDDAPGQFGLADEQTTSGILESAGWQAVELMPVDVACSFPESELVRYFSALGPLARYFDAVPQDRIPRNLKETVRKAFSPFVVEGTVRFSAACWMIRADA